MNHFSLFIPTLVRPSCCRLAVQKGIGSDRQIIGYMYFIVLYLG